MLTHHLFPMVAGKSNGHSYSAPSTIVTQAPLLCDLGTIAKEEDAELGYLDPMIGM